MSAVEHDLGHGVSIMWDDDGQGIAWRHPACRAWMTLRFKPDPRSTGHTLLAGSPATTEHLTIGGSLLCPAGCGMRVRRVDGKPVGVSGILDHPVNHGSLCPKGAAALQELYHPDRVRTPLVRSGPRGAGVW